MDALLAADGRDDLAARYRQAYEAWPADAVDVWGDLGAWHAELARIRAVDRDRSGTGSSWE